MTRIYTTLDRRNIDNAKYEVLINPFIFDSDELKKAGLNYHVVVPAGFVFDEESVPYVRGTNKRGGTAHDYLCRIDSDPIVTKSLAASVYLEIMSYTYEITDRSYWQHFKDFTKRWFKWGVVYVAPGYFHKFKVMASCKEICGMEGDPYVTIQKLEDAIVQSEQATDAIKSIPAQVEGKEGLVQESKQVTETLKDVKSAEEMKNGNP